MRHINRDPFARETLVRRTADYPRIMAPGRCLPGCAWCGQFPRQRGYQYGAMRDSILGTRVSWDPHVYCCIGCFRAFVGG
jgi:hypothetical protein